MPATMALMFSTFGCRICFPAEGEQLSREAGRPLAGLLDLEEILPRSDRRRQPFQHQLAEPENRRQHVVEVVRDAAGELADRLQLLRLAQLFLEQRAAA